MCICNVRDQTFSRFMRQQIGNIWTLIVVNKVLLIADSYVAKDTSGRKASFSAVFLPRKYSIMVGCQHGCYHEAWILFTLGFYSLSTNEIHDLHLNPQMGILPSKSPDLISGI